MEKQHHRSNSPTDQTNKNSKPNSSTENDVKGSNRSNIPNESSARREEEKELEEESKLPEDPDPILDEQDLQENNLSVEEADQIEWEPQAKTSKQQDGNK